MNGTSTSTSNRNGRPGPATSPEAQPAWWHALYDDYLAEILLEREDPGQVSATLDFLVETLKLEAGQLVFDQCCGIGSLALPLAARGYALIGVDQAANYIARAEKAARRSAGAGAQQLDARFFADDAFEFVAPAPADAAFNWWTSFGYDESDAVNLRMLRRAFESLRPGGRFALDTMNVPGLLRNFRPRETTRRATSRGELRLLRESRLDLARGMIHKTWTFTPAEGPALERKSSVRLYMPDALAALLNTAGFTDVTLYGSVAGEVLELDSPRCICVARRPEESV